MVSVLVAIGNQLFTNPQGLAMAAGAAAFAGLLPGMPIIPFALLAGGAGYAAYRAFRGQREKADKIESRLGFTVFVKDRAGATERVRFGVTSNWKRLGDCA